MVLEVQGSSACYRGSNSNAEILILPIKIHLEIK